jgi:hypothetical protein
MIILNTFENENYILTVINIVICFFVKEAVIIFLPFFILKSYFNKNLKIAFIFAIELIVLGIILHTRGSYGFSMRQFSGELVYHGIFIDNGLISALFNFLYLVGINYTFYLYGVIIFAAFIGFLKIDWKEKLLILMLSGEVLSLFPKVADWDRMMFLLFPFIIDLGMKVLNQIKSVENINKKIYDYMSGFILFVWLIIYPLILLFGKDCVKYLNLISGVGLLGIYIIESRAIGLKYKQIFLTKFETGLTRNKILPQDTL